MTSIDTFHSPSVPNSAMLGAMLPRLGRQTIYVMTSFPLAVISFSMLVTGLALGGGLLVTLIGLPVLVGSLLLARGFAFLERTRMARLMEVEVEPAVYLSANTDEGLVKRGWAVLRDGQSWLDVVHAIVGFPVATAVWSVVLTWWATALGGLTWVFWGWSLPSGPDNDDLPELLGLGTSYPVRAAFYTAFGIFAAVTLPWVVMAASHIYAGLGNLLLVLPGNRRQQIDYLVEGREATRAAETTSLRRLERDIHDGPQQRLVRLSMDLGRASRKAGSESPELVDALNDAQRQTQETLDELRNLSRGIAPPILADRGLKPALEELAVRSALPAEVAVSMSHCQPKPHVEAAVYFLVAETLTNVNKHSGATQASVGVHYVDPMVRVSVIDDGIGGAHLSKGHGLAGLAERIRAVDGTFEISSPPGGPTRVTAEIPCE